MNTGAFPEMGYTEGGADLGENQEFAFVEFEVRIIVQVERQSCLHLCVPRVGTKYVLILKSLKEYRT